MVGFAQPMDYFRNLNVSDGLPSNFITSVHEDKEGYMWFGTEDGLVRYDGLTFEKFFHDPLDSSSIGFDHVGWDISENSEGGIWVSLYGQGFSRYDPLTTDFTSFTFANGKLPAKWADHVQNFMFSEDGFTYINCVDGILRVNSKDEVEVVSDVRKTRLVNDVGQLRVATLHEDRWIWCTSTRGLACYDLEKDSWEFPGANPAGKNAFKGKWTIHSAAFHEGTLWFSPFQSTPGFNHRYLYKYNLLDDALDSIPIAPGLARSEPFSDLTNSILVQKDGDISLATAGLGILTYNELTKEWTQQMHSSNWGGTISQGQVRILFQDQSENLWVGTESGLGIKSSRSLFRNFPQAASLGGNSLALSGIRNAAIDDSGGLWFGMEGEGLYQLDSAKTIVGAKLGEITAQSDIGNYHEPLLVNDESLIYHVWFDGLRALNTKTGKISRIPVNESKEMPELRNVFRSKDGQIYAWGRNRFGKLNSETWQFDFVQTPGSGHGGSDMVLDVAENERGNLWIGTLNNGLICIDPSDMSVVDQWKRDTASYPSTSVSQVVCTDERIYFSMFDEGLWTMDLKTRNLNSYGKHNGLCSNGVEGLILDQSGSLWIYSSSGISWFDEANERFRTFTESDGMVSQQVRDAELLPAGNILLVTDKGLIEFHPETLKMPQEPSTPKLRSLVVFDQEINLHAWSLNQEKIRVSYDQNYLRAEFSAMEFFDPERIKFAYRMDGIEENWNQTDNHPVATYSNLSGGNYNLCVKQTNSFGEWGPELCIPIFVTTPIYFQSWFVVLATLLILLLGYWIYRWQLSKRMAVMHVRNRVSRDLHDDIGSTLSSINIFSSVAQDQLGEREGETKKVLEQISEGAEEMMQNMDDIVWVINPNNDAIGNLQTRMLAYAVPILEAKDIDLTTQLITNDNMLKLSMDKRKNLFLIFKEVINNIAKHSGATEAFLSLEINGKEINLSVEDNGCGFDPETTSSRNGIKNLKARAKEVCGDIQFVSNAETGTTITVKVPIP
jgi:ligand-binding sensor domain-containing protein/two-component sensor histidine kinase